MVAVNFLMRKMERTSRRRGQVILLMVFFLGSLSFILYNGPWRYGLNEENPLVIEVSIDDAEVYIGTPIRYSITIRMLPGTRVEFPEMVGDPSEFVLKAVSTSSLRRGLFTLVQSRVYSNTSFSSGSYRIPAPLIRYTRMGREFERLGDEMIIEFKSVIPEGEEPRDIRDVRPPFAPRGEYLIPLQGAVIFVIALAAGIWFWRRRRVQYRRGLLGVRLTAPRIAYEQLRRIRDLRLIERGRAKEYYSLLSNCVRQYLENGFGITARRMTTEEFIVATLNSDLIEEGEKRLLTDFLSACDMVKFARHTPTTEEMERAYESAKRLIEGLRPREVMRSGNGLSLEEYNKIMPEGERGGGRS